MKTREAKLDGYREWCIEQAERQEAALPRAARDRRYLRLGSAEKPALVRSGASYPIDDPRWWVEDRYCHDLRTCYRLIDTIPDALILKFRDGVVDTSTIKHEFLFWLDGDDFRADLIETFRVELLNEDFF